MLDDCVSVIYVLQWWRPETNVGWRNYMSSHDKRCYKSLVHKQVVHVKFIIGLLNNTLPAEHETSKSLVGLWSGNRARRTQCVPRDVTWHKLNAHSCKDSVDIPPLIAVWYQAWCQGVASGSVKDKRVLHTIHVLNLSHPVVSGELHARLKC